MASRLPERCAVCRALLNGRWFVCRYQSVVSRLYTPSWEDLRRALTVNFILTLVCLGMLAYLIWGFDYVGDLNDRIVLSVIPALLVPMVFWEALRQEQGSPQFSLSYGVYTLFTGLLLVVAVSDKFDLELPGVNAIVMMASSPWLLIFWMLARQKRLLVIGMVPAAILLMAYFVLPEALTNRNFDYLLFPLPAVSILTALWTSLVWVFLKGVDRWSDHSTLGPLMESLAMFFLFIPSMILAIWVPRAFPGGDDWSVVLAAMVGVVFGSVVSQPLRLFLLGYGDLPSYRRLGQGDQVDGYQGREDNE